ncbi:virulence factor MviN [Ancylobacter sp. A5.8]|uniref:murein biosynthesis integral membrane protein MurJ n=1 Tax=Ancylobacter gelatini TaxID=2919920 RepID=UPI001F4E7ED8|nr:lipid II flippase MurJ [Ancylobacter gelatini]MCJ8143513.1 virulence factor MviN [Ancylobacter gelatini]
MALFRHASTVAALTLTSRVLGFARDAAIASLFGTGVVADAAVAGLALPQLARRLLGEGALNGAIAPRLGSGAAAAQRASGALALFALVASALALLAYVFMPWVVAVMMPGFPADGPREAGAVLAGRLAVICLPLAAVAGVLAALANAAGRVTRPAMAPALANVAVIAVIALLYLSGAVETGSEVTNLAWLAGATVAGAVVQLLVMVSARPDGALAAGLPRAARRAGVFAQALRAALPMLAAAGPSLFAAALPQLRFLLAAAAASALSGGVAALFFATRLVELPLGLVGASAGAVLLPALAAGGTDGTELRTRSVEAALALALPAALGLAVLAHPIVSVLFQRGAFDASATELTARAVALLALTIPIQALEKVLAAIAFARGFGRLVIRANLLALPAGAAAGFLGAGALGIAGPALGVVAASLLGTAGLALALARRGLVTLDRPARRRVLALVGSAVAMALLLMLAARALDGPLAAGGLRAALVLAGLVGLGVAVYGTLAARLGAVRLPALRAALRE